MSKREGGLIARDKNLERDPDFYRKIGRLGGTKSRGGGFSKDRSLAVRAGKLGGAKSRKHTTQK